MRSLWEEEFLTDNSKGAGLFPAFLLIRVYTSFVCWYHIYARQKRRFEKIGNWAKWQRN